MIRTTTAAIFAAALLALPASAAFAAPIGGGVLNETIPPNCTLDPWTGKMTCHIWPSCTLDPWTGKMNCPVGGLAPVWRAH